MATLIIATQIVGVGALMETSVGFIRATWRAPVMRALWSGTLCISETGTMRALISLDFPLAVSAKRLIYSIAKLLMESLALAWAKVKVWTTKNLSTRLCSMQE